MSGAQRKANRRAIDEVQGGFRQYHRGLDPASGPPLVPAASAAVAISGMERQAQDGRRMNNIGSANVVISKRPTKEEAEADYGTYVCPIIAATQSQKSAPTKGFRPKNFQPTSQATKPAARNAERPLAQQASQNLEQLKELQLPCLSPPLTKLVQF